MTYDECLPSQGRKELVLCGKEKRGRVIFKAKSTITYGGADSFFKGIKSDSNDH